MNRLGYGMSEWHSTRYDQLGFDGYVNEQFGDSLPALTPRGTTTAAKIERAVLARRQLEANLLDFWFNHFNVDATGGVVERTVGAHQSAIQAHLLGNFEDMLVATAKSPAMLDYLDNRVNYKVEQRGGREYGLNENYARELMELHTLGVDGGYSEGDIIEVARVLTGWSVAQDAYTFRRARHDSGQKTVMGATFPAGREEEEGLDLLQMLADHPSTASFISRKLCRRLVSENPPTAVVNIGASAFSSSDGDLAATTRAIVLSDGFRDDAAFRAKVKPPHRYLASAVMAMGADARGQFGGLRDEIDDGVEVLGEEPYQVPPPTGYPESSEYWVSGTSMLGRFQQAGIIAGHGALRSRLVAVAGTNGSGAAATVEAVAAYMVPGGISSATRTAAEQFVSETASTNDQRLTTAAHAILSSPEFVRH